MNDDVSEELLHALLAAEISFGEQKTTPDYYLTLCKEGVCSRVHSMKNAKDPRPWSALLEHRMRERCLTYLVMDRLATCTGLTWSRSFNVQ